MQLAAAASTVGFGIERNGDGVLHFAREHTVDEVFERVERLTPTIVEVVVRAPAAARRFAPGQFYRLQNFEMLASSSSGTRLTMEGIALTGAWVDRERGLVSTIVLEMGGSSNLCATLKPGDYIWTGTPTGAGVHRNPAVWLKPGDVVEVEAPGIGVLRNKVVDEA